ncbi:MAG TPA: tRNA pseudouridine(38-40) synthase TruA [bacterium]|nr:tRNA pseudouridine(38-40) synthase TruA [bacterium]
MTVKNFRLTLSYNGAGYYGWQKQSKFLSVQGLLEYALEKFLGAGVKTTGASRTDAGVHAYGQVVNFRAHTPLDAAGMKAVLNGLLPEDIRVINASLCNPGFNARHNVRKKLYRYVIRNSGIMYPFYRDFCWHLDKKTDTEKIKAVLPLFEGVKDYFSFTRSGGETENYERRVDSIKMTCRGRDIFLDFTAKSFLYNMIRKITAALVCVGDGEMNEGDIRKMFEARDRRLCRHLAPPGGLYLVKIIYERENGNTSAD